MTSRPFLPRFSMTALVAALSLFTLSALTPAIARAQSAYLAGSGGKFGTLNLATGAYVSVGTSAGSLVGLGFVGSTLYGLRDTGTTLGTVNTANGAFTSLGAITGLGSSILYSLTSLNGTLYGIDDSASSVVYTINPTTRVATAVGSIGIGVTLDTITAGPGNTLYGSFRVTPTNNGFISINPVTGTGSALPSNPSGITGNAFGLGYVSGTMYAVLSDGKIGTVNLTTGAYTANGQSNLTTLTGVPYALVAIPSGSAAPEPGSVALLGLGMIGGVAVLRRRK